MVLSPLNFSQLFLVVLLKIFLHVFTENHLSLLKKKIKYLAKMNLEYDRRYQSGAKFLSQYFM